MLQLRDEGRLDLNDRLDAHLPGVGYGDRTIRSLLSHSSGMHSEPAGEWWERTPGGSFDELASRLERRRPGVPVRAPRSTTPTSPSGCSARWSSRLTGMPWFDAVKARLLDPLGMARTTYLPEPPAAQGYSVHHFAGTLDEEPAHDAGAMAPAGQVWSTVEDLARYAAFLAGGNAEVLADRTLDEMATPQSGSLAGGLAGGYGLGFRLVAGGSGVLLGHTGSMPGFLAGLFVDRRRRTGAVVLANGTHGLRCEGLPMDLLAALEELEPTLPPAWQPVRDVPPEVADVLGVWHWGNTAYAFAWTGTELVASLLSSGAESQRFARARRSARRQQRLPPRRDAAGRPQRGRVGQPPGVRDVRLHAHAVRPGRPDPRRSARLTEGSLLQRHAGEGPEELTPQR